MSEGADTLEGLDEKTPKMSEMSDTGQHQIPPPSSGSMSVYSTEFFAGIERISPYIAIFNSTSQATISEFHLCGSTSSQTEQERRSLKNIQNSEAQGKKMSNMSTYKEHTKKKKEDRS